MNKKLLIGAPLLAIAAFAVTPVAAQATQPHWYHDNILNTNVPRTILEWGVVSYKDTSDGINITCHTAGVGTEDNPNPVATTAGVSSTEAIVYLKCEQIGFCPPSTTIAVTAVPTSLPWPSVLEQSGAVIRSKTTGIKTRAACFNSSGVEVGGDNTIGSITPSVQNGMSALHPSFAEFDGGGSGLLEACSDECPDPILPEGEVKFLGFDEQELISAKNP
jgi:hypothetical protein